MRDRSRTPDLTGDAVVAKPQIVAVVEKELRDGARGSGIDFAAQVVEVLTRALCFRMHFGISGNRDLEVGHRTQPANEVEPPAEFIWARDVAWN